MATDVRSRITIWRLMLMVAVVAVVLVMALPLWRYWFASPIRTVVYENPGYDRPTTVIFDTRNPAIAAALSRMRAQFDSNGFPYRIERSQAPTDAETETPSDRTSR